MDRTRELLNNGTIWNFLGGVSVMSGLACFGLSSTYKILFGKLGVLGLFVYLLISSIMLCFIYFVVRIRVPEKFQVVAETTLFVVMSFISFELDELVPGKSDAFSIISYGLFALMSLCASRKSELGFEAGFFSFFLTLFLKQIYKTNWKLVLVALGSCFAALLRRYSQSDSPNGDRPNEVVPPNEVAIGIPDEENLLLPIEDAPLNESGIEISGVEDINEEESSNSSDVSSANNQNGNGHSTPLGLFQRRSMKPATQSISGGLEGSPMGSGNGWIKLVLIEGRDLDAAHLRPFVRVCYGNWAEKTKVIGGTRNPVWNKTLKFHDDGSRLLLYIMNNHVLAPTKIDAFELVYRSFPLNHMVDKWILLNEGRGGKIHIQITRKGPEIQEKAEPSSTHLHQIPTQIKERRLEDGNIEGSSTALSELEKLEDTEEVYIDELATANASSRQNKGTRPGDH